MIILPIVTTFAIFVLIAGMTLQIREFFRLRNDCETRKDIGSHDWEYHYILNDSCVRICKDCEIRQFRLDEGYFWGEQ